jgi:hypothetical protein
LFNVEHPDVPVVIDRGRYQVVKIDAARAESISGDHCYSLLPFEGDIRVFDIVQRRAARQDIPDWERELVAMIDPAAFTANVDMLTAPNSRHSIAPEFQATVAALKARLETLGYATRIDPIQVRRQNGTLLGPSSNLVAMKSGAGPQPRGIVAVTAHLDSINLSRPEDVTAQAPGADDNASGSAGLLEMARVFATVPTEQDLLFVLFGGEEEGLFGSTQFVAALPAGERSRIRGVVNMDMIGVVNKPPQTVLLEGGLVSQGVMDALSDRAFAHTGLAVRQSLHFAASDHVPFIQAGIPAVLAIEGDDDQNSTIHTPADTKDKLSADYAAKILRMNTGYLASVAGLVATRAKAPIFGHCNSGDKLKKDFVMPKEHDNEPRNYNILYDTASRSRRGIPASAAPESAGHRRLAAEASDLSVSYDEAIGLPNQVFRTVPGVPSPVRAPARARTRSGRSRSSSRGHGSRSGRRSTALRR